MATLTVLPEGEQYPLSPAVSVLNTLLRGGHRIQHRCGGKAQCGTCRVVVREGGEKLSPVREPERNRLGEEKLAAGYRLACQTHAFSDLVIEIPPPDSDGA